MGSTSRKLRCTTPFRLAIERIAAHFVIGHDGDEHGHDGRTILGGGDLGTELFADGLPDDPVAPSAIRLENLHNNKDKEPDPSNRREADRDQVVHFHPGFTPSCFWLGTISHLKQNH